MRPRGSDAYGQTRELGLTPVAGPSSKAVSASEGEHLLAHGHGRCPGWLRARSRGLCELGWFQQRRLQRVTEPSLAMPKSREMRFESSVPYAMFALLYSSNAFAAAIRRFCIGWGAGIVQIALLDICP